MERVEKERRKRKRMKGRGDIVMLVCASVNEGSDEREGTDWILGAGSASADERGVWGFF